MARKSSAQTVEIGVLSKSFKLPKPVKAIMALQFPGDAHRRGAYKCAMINAELTYLANKKKQISRADIGKDE